MLARAFRNKLKVLITLLLLACTLSQSVTPAFAGDNGSHTSTGHKAEVVKYYLTSLKQNLAVFLADGTRGEFVLDRAELTASVQSQPGKTYISRDYANTFNKAYRDMSVSKAYAQIFKRTQVAWGAEGVSESLMLMGRDVFWGGGVGPGGGVTMSADNSMSKSNAYFQEHRMGYDPHGLKSRLYSNYLKTGWPKNLTGWEDYNGEIKGKGVLKQQIQTYLEEYFEKDGVHKQTPYEFIESTYNKAKKEKKTKDRAYHIWAYISAGADATADGVPNSAPIERWRDIFEGDDRLSADNIFIGDELYEKVGDDIERPLDWYTDPRIRSQAAAYFDTLISLALMAEVNGKTKIAEHYLEAAKTCFGKPGAFAKEPTALVQSKSIVFDTWSTQCYTAAGQASKGTVVTYTDNWGMYRRAYYPKTAPKRDWRSLSPIYNDYHVTPIATESRTYQKWALQNESRASTDRIAVRLSLLDKSFPKDFSTWSMVDDTKIDISYASVWHPALSGFGAVASSLGRSVKRDENGNIVGVGETQKISPGLKGVWNASRNHHYAGFDGSKTLDMVGGQSVIFLYAQGSKSPSVFPSVQRIGATPNSKKVEPNPTGLNQNIKITYSLGNAIAPETKAKTYRTVTYDKQLLKRTLDWLRYKEKFEGGELYVRTYVTREVTRYRLNTLWLAGAGKAQTIRTPGIGVDEGQSDVLPAIKTSLGTLTVPKADFDSDKGWSKISIATYEALFTNHDCLMFPKTDDEFYRSKQWSVTTQPTDYIIVDGENNTKKIYYPGYDFSLKVLYRADTQFKVVTKDKETGEKEPVMWDYSGKTGASVEKYANSNPDKKSPYVLSISTQTEDYAPTANSASFKYKKDPEVLDVDYELIKESMPYAVYSSSPEAYAELKNWGVSSNNEPHDSTGLGDGRSPMDTQLGVTASNKSNGSSIITEDYEAMAGVPTTEKLYLAIGGSEFIVDIAVQYVPNETAVRTYRTHFDGVDSQFNYASASGAGGDIPDDTVWGSHAVPQPKGLKSGVTATVKTSNGGKSINPHDGGTYTLEIKGTIHNDGVDGKLVISDHDGGTYPYPYGNGKGSDSSFPPRAPASPQGSNGSGSQLTAAEAAKGNGMPLVGSATVERVPNTTHDSPVSWAWAVPRKSDVAAFNDCMDDTVKQWIDDMVTYFKTSPGFKAGSDGITRRFGDGEVGEFTYTKDKLQDNIVGYPLLTADKGRLDITPPNNLFRFEGDVVAGESFNIVSFKTNDVYEVTNPANKSAKATSSNNGTLRTISYEIQVKSAGTTYSIKTIPGTPAVPPDIPKGPDTYEQLTASYSNSNSWSGSITGKWTDGHNIEWFAQTAEGQAEYNAFVAQYNADLAAANAWVAAENAKTAGTGSGGLKTGVGDVSASITVNKPVYTSTAFVPDTGSSSATAKKDKDYDWSASYTFTVEKHTLCGPECGHKLPEINDVWQQSINYDYLKIIGLSILRLDQGAASDITPDGSGLSALIGTSKLGVTRQTYYSSPTMSLAQANIFNYMGYQTDGTKDVNEATNEYFRSIAYGIGTTWGNTRSSEANRVKYWMTNADGSKLTAKGPTFQRLTYKGNTAASTPYNNELLSAWGEGNVKANDYVEYNFGSRSNLSDGTSRGYKYNVNKSSWIENVNGEWRGKAAYDLPWAKGFIYDGVKADGTVDASGFSVSRLYRNSLKSGSTGLEGIVQDGVKGWQGKGMNTSTVGWKGGKTAFSAKNMIEAYETDENGKLFEVAYYLGSRDVKLYQPAIRDWSRTRHLPYADTRNLIEPGGGVMPGAEKGDISSRDYMSKMWEETAVKDDDRFAQSQPYDTNDMLRAYTNTASDNGVKIRETPEFKLMQAKRDELVQATIISDALILDLPNGLQPIVYHYKNASTPGQAENRLPDTRITFDELWTNNIFTPNGWADSSTGTVQDGIIIGGYNGDLSGERVTGDVPKRMQWRADEVPATPNMFIQTKTAAIEAPDGVIGSKLGAKVVNGTNINLYLAHNTTAPTRILSLPVTNKSAVGAPVQRTLLYNITPMLLSADNREYYTGLAEAFWETLVLWKDSSNHDYYGAYVDKVKVTKPDVYIAKGDFIRLPALLDNYGQVQRSAVDVLYEADIEEDYDPMEAELDKYFKDSRKLDAYGAEGARSAQLEQYHRGFGVAGYNYDTTNNAAIDDKRHKHMYNKSDDLTEAAKGNPYVTDGKLGVPFILEGITEANFETDKAVRHIGKLPADKPKSGYIMQTAYTRGDADSEKYQLNPIVVHNPVTARTVQIMPIASWRDQRSDGQSMVASIRNQVPNVCPGTVELCEHATLDCKYDKPLELLNLNLVGSGNSVLNTAIHSATTGNIVFAGNYALSSTGLSSNGSPRTGVSLSDLGGTYYSSLDYQVTAKVTYSANTGEQMLFGFESYGITLNTATKKLAIRVSGKAGYIDVAGTFNSGDTLKVQFGSANATLSKVWVNGSLRTITAAGGATFDTMAIGPHNVGDVFYIGSWNSGTPAYLPTASTKLTSLLFERLAGSHQHTLACMKTITHHVGGNNTHIHKVEDLGPSDSKKYLNGTLQDWNNYVIDDATLRERLGEVLWTALGLPKAQTTVLTDSDITLTTAPVTNNFSTVGTHTYVAPHDGEYFLEAWGAAGGGNTPRTVTVDPPVVNVKGNKSFSYTGNVQTFTAPETGTYTLEVWGAEGGRAYGNILNNYGMPGLGGYSKGTVSLTAGETIYVVVGQAGGSGSTGGYNGGGKGSNTNSTSTGGGATHIAKRTGLLSSLSSYKSDVLLVAGGGGGTELDGQPSSMRSGAGGGLTGGVGLGNLGGSYANCAGGGGTQTAGGVRGTKGSGGNVGLFGQGGAAGPSHSGGGGGGWYGGASGNSNGGGGGGSGYIGGVINGTMSDGVRSGHGYAVISWETPAEPLTGPIGSVGGKGGYASGYVTLKKGDVVTINVGGQGTQAASGAFGGGGFNGGGNGANTGFGGGGATDIRINGVSLDHRVLVAGGGGGADNPNVGLAGTLDDGSGGHGGGVEGGGAYINGVQLHYTGGASIDTATPLGIWSASGNVTWDATEKAYKGVGPVQMYLKSAYSYPIDSSKVYKINVTAKVSNTASKTFYWGGDRLNASKAHLPGYGGTYDYAAASNIPTGNMGWTTYSATKTGTSASMTGWGTDTAYYALGGLLNYSGSSSQVTWVKNIELYEDGVLVQAIDTGRSKMQLGIGESATVLTDTGGGGGGYYGGLATNNNNGGGGGGSGYIGGVTSGTLKAGQRSGNGYAVITAPNIPSEHTYTFTVTGGPKEFEASALIKSGSGKLQLDLYEGNTANPSKLIDTVIGNPSVTYPSARQVFEYTGKIQTFTAPHTGTYTFEAWGAQGGYGDGNFNEPGLGGYATGTYKLTEGQSINVYVGGAGTSYGGNGGWNGGGSVLTAGSSPHRGGTGGGATDFRVGGTALSNRILVAGGGGGGQPSCGGKYTTAGHGGGLVGVQSYNQQGNYAGSYANGGTQSAGGTGYGKGNWTATGSLGQGANTTGDCGAGGGGGYYGGGAAYTAGGGGGSGYIGKVSGGYMQTGIRSGNGRAVISWQGEATPTMLKAGTYTIVLKTLDVSTVTVRLKASLKGRNLQYSDIIGLPNINGEEAWRQLPYYLSNGNRNPVYSCNGELNAHVEAVPKSQYFTYTGDAQLFTAPVDGVYKIEAWGAQGGDGRYSNTVEYRDAAAGGKGAYVAGSIELKAGDTLYVYVGGQGGRTTYYSTTGGAGGWNGGGNGGTDTDSSAREDGAGGGGATDIRLTDGVWNNTASLRSRIMVAGGGGGSSSLVNDIRIGRPGGTLTAKGVTPYTVGGTQTTGGGFGIGADGWSETQSSRNYGGFGGGGGGYYGGAFGQLYPDAYGVGGAGGSSFISGYLGCNAINASGAHTGQPNHYSGKIFTDATMTEGVNKGNGRALISWTEPTLCYTEVTYDNCTEPHHTGGHYPNDPLCYSPCLDDSRHDTNFVRSPKVNSFAAEFVSIDWDYTLYADTIDSFRASTAYQLATPSDRTGLGYYDMNQSGEFDTVRFIRGKYVKFPWMTLYDGVLYNPGEWIVLGDRGDYAQGLVSRGNNGTGFGGNVQSGFNGVGGTDDLWHGEQAAEYNVKNWSLYNQQLYKDLYKDFYDFYVPLANDEMSLGSVVYATVGVNARDTREPSFQEGRQPVLSALANINTWTQGSLVNNSMRTMNMAEVGAGKIFYVDVVGRIGGLVMTDTTDIKFSNTFKQASASVSDTQVTYVAKKTVTSDNIQELTIPEQMKTEGKVLDASGSLSSRVLMKSTSDWVGFTYAGGNARKYVITINGNNLKAGELTVNVEDAANGNYTLRMSDMTVTTHSDQTISVICDVKQTNAAVTIIPKFSLIDTDRADVYVINMVTAIGGSGFSQGLNKLVDENRQNYYITDITDVRGIYLGATVNTGSAVEGKSSLATTRYSSYYDLADWIRISNATQVRDGSRMSQRTTPAYGTRAVNTYGTRPWVQEGDPLYKALASNGGKALIGPLTSKYNTISQYRTAEDQLAVGSKIFFDVTTLGSYSTTDSSLKIIPSYYLVDPTRRDESGAVALIPVDVYQLSSTGVYHPVNIFGAPYGGFTDTKLDTFNQYRLSVHWEDEIDRRMVTFEERLAAEKYADLYTEYIYDSHPYDHPGLDLDDPDTYPIPSGKTPSPRNIPQGVMSIGGSQFIHQDYQTQTYIGSHRTYGVDKSGGLFTEFEADPTQSQKYIYWQVAAQRWHSTLGLPSDSVFVPLAQDPVTNKFNHRDVTDIPNNIVDIRNSYIICYLDIYAEGAIWTLHYDNQGIQRRLSIGGDDYDLPNPGPVGPATTNPYPGQHGVGVGSRNYGVPIGVFGGTRVEGQAEIIKVN